MLEVRASYVGIRVVSAKLPEQWIVRGIRRFSDITAVEDMVLDYVGRLPNPDIEWTTYEYQIPHYIAYDLNPVEYVNTYGVYLFKYVGFNTYKFSERLDNA